MVRNLKEIPGIRGASYRISEGQKRIAFALRAATSYARFQLERNGARPEVAAVVVGRNDDYMSDFRERLFATVDWNIRYLVNEVIFVEWNPPADRELLGYELTRRFPSLRAYVVPPEIHAGLCENHNVKLLEYHAKNVGIRRAKSPFIMVTNADAAVGLDTVNNLMSAKLDAETAWTAERVDISWREDQQSEIGLLGSLRYRRVIPYNRLGTGEFCLAARELWHNIRGYDELMVKHRIGCDVRGTAQMLAHGASLKKSGTVLHLAHPTSCTENIQLHHGEMATVEGVPYHNPDDWGLGNCREEQLAERVWRLSDPPAIAGGPKPASR
jgi:hypothetical protein